MIFTKPKLIITILFFIGIYSNLKSQILNKVEYTIRIKLPKNESQKNIQAKELMDSAEDVIASLIFSKTESFYKLEEVMENDGESKINLTRILANTKSQYYYNMITKEFLQQINNSAGDFRIINKLIEWELTQESKKIGKYTCFKAIKKAGNEKSANTEVWYTPEIPVGFGPAEYNGLPGLIIEVQGPLIYRANKIQLNAKKTKKIKKPEQGRLISREEYSKLMKEYFPGLFQKN